MQEALYKVQGRIAKTTDGLRALDEGEARLDLERQRIDLLRMRASGGAEVDGAKADDLSGVELEDEK